MTSYKRVGLIVKQIFRWPSCFVHPYLIFYHVTYIMQIRVAKAPISHATICITCSFRRLLCATLPTMIQKESRDLFLKNWTSIFEPVCNIVGEVAINKWRSMLKSIARKCNTELYLAVFQHRDFLKCF